ncbi:MAG: metallopeptidase TldD-related protein [Rhizobiaceae bacterium]
MPSSDQEEFELAPLQERAAALVEAAKQAGADAADAVVAASRSTGVEVREGKVEETESAENNAFALRVFIGKRAASVSANMTGDPFALAERAVAMAKVAPEDPHNGLADEDKLSKNFPDLDLYDSTNPEFDTMRDIALACEEAALSIEGVTKSSGASFARGLGGTVLATSNGFLGSYRASRFSLSVSAVAGEGENMERDYDYDSMRFMSDLRGANEIGLEAGKRAVKRLNPKQVKTQTATVIFDPRVARGLVGHLSGAINGASIARKTSFLRDDMGAKIFAPNVTIVDEPHIIRGAASRPFDAEGVASERLNLVENGILKTWLLDTGTAKELNLTTNGRANRAGSGTSPGSTNLTMLAGKRTPEDMIRNLKNGFYVTDLIGQGVNLLTGDYSRGASGFWIENGELTYTVSEVTIAGKLRDMFAKLIPASDLEIRFGINSPTIAIEGMTIAGQ